MRNFIRKSKYFSIFKRFLSFIFALIILSSFISCQFFVASVSAAEIGAVESVAVTVGTLYSAVKSGEASSVVMDFFKRAVVFASEIRTNYFMPSDTIDSFYDNYMLSLDSKIDSGNLVEADIGNIKYVGGYPVSFDCSTLGCYCFFCNRAIADRIDAYSGQKNISVVASIVDGYWDDEFYRIRRPNFGLIVSDPDNWRCSFDSSSIGVDGSTNVNVIYQSFFDTFGETFSEPSDLFYQTGEYGIINWSGRTYSLTMPVNSIPNYTDFIIIKYEASYSYPVQYIRFYGHRVSEVDPHIYTSITGNWGRKSDFRGFTATDGLKEITLSKERAESLGLTFSSAPDIDITDIFPNYGDLVEGGQIGVLDPSRGWWNTREFDDAVDLVGDAVAEAVQTGVTDVPLDIPDIVDVEDLPITDWADTGDFVDTTGVVAADDETDFPDIPIVNPEPDPPEDPDRPELNIPVLGSLFPFCIPFDIYNAFRALNTTSVVPVWDIPFNLSLGNRQITNTVLHIDLTSNGLDFIFSSLRVVQILVFIVGLGMFTKRFIF